MPGAAPKPEARINATLKPSGGLKSALRILSQEEWVKLQAFSDAAVNDYPSTDESMRLKLGLKNDADLKQDFKEAVKLYSTLKGYCTTFRDKIKPQTIELADDIVQYNRTAQVIYGRLIALLEAYDETGKVSPETWKKFLEALKEEAPPPDALKVQTAFVKYIKRLAGEAAARSTKAQALKAQLSEFNKHLGESKSAFDLRNRDYLNKHADLAVEIQKLKDEFKRLEADLAVYKKKEHDEVLVLETAPLYLIIPGFGPLIMAGVLIGVGVDLGVLRETLKGKEEELQERQKKLGQQNAFYLNFETATTLLKDTKTAIEGILPLVERLDKAWAALASDLEDLKKNVEKAKSEALSKDWMLASVDLEVAMNAWADLSEQADQYRRFGDAKRVEDMNQFVAAIKTDKAA